MSEIENQIIKVAGSRSGTWCYLYKRRRYYFDAQKSKNKNIYRSAERRNGCQSVIYEYPDGTIEENGMIPMGLDDSGAIEKAHLKSELDQAVRAGETLKDITNNLSGRYAHVKTKAAIHMQARRANPPLKLSQDLKVLAESIKKYKIEGDTIVQGMISIETGAAIIFYSKEMLQALHLETTITIDLVKNTYCSFIVYLSGPSQQLYEEILLYILNVAPLLKEVKTVFTGTDNDAMNAILVVLPDANPKIQWLDFIKSVGGIWHESGLEGAPLQILHYLWILGVSGEENIETGLTLIDQKISLYIDKFPSLGSFFFLFKSRWEERLQFLGAPLEALQLCRRAEAIGRYLYCKFTNCTKSVQKLTGALHEILTNERKLMEAFVNDTPREVNDKTIRCFGENDCTKFSRVYKLHRSGRINLQSFFDTCFSTSVLDHLVTLIGIQSKTRMTVQQVTNGGEATEVVSVFNARRKLNFTNLKRKSNQTNRSLPSTSGMTKQQRAYGENSGKNSEILSDDEDCDWEYNGQTFVWKNNQR